ncbi:Pterin-4-alpha-carbinolamine dehydratase [Actinomycetales bacterium JB111]|nr:Pterin-4-alpha-carbinolamine dehydratase [Actinomycetales bacterium JB111]
MSTDRLTYRQIAEADLDDFRPIFETIRATFETGSFAVGLDLVSRIGALAEAANHHPDVTLTYGSVRVLLTSHDAGAVTSRDLDLAREISAVAREMGVGSNPGSVAQIELALDAPDGGALAPFYAALLGARASGDEVTDPSGQSPSIWFQAAESGGPGIPEPDPAQRWHIDVAIPLEEAEQRVRDVIAAGGTLVSDAAAPSYWVLEDAEGNRACVCTAYRADETD